MNRKDELIEDIGDLILRFNCFEDHSIDWTAETVATAIWPKIQEWLDEARQEGFDSGWTVAGGGDD